MSNVMKIFAAAFLAALSLTAVGAPMPPRDMPAVQTAVPPQIDGDISDSAWQRPADCAEFFHRETGAAASEKTSAWVCYDSKYIYIAFRCEESRPESIRAAQKKRGGSLDKDDYVRVDIDPWHTHLFMYTFSVSARGTQNESIPGVGGTKIEWRGDWLAAAKIQPYGWSAEMAIPWAILKYPPNQSVMGLAFFRRHSRSDLVWSSPDLGPSDDEQLMLNWTGLQPPPPSLHTTALAYINTGWGGGSLKAGLDVKKQLSQQINALLTLNPDFQSIEQDVESIDFTYSPRVLSDNRAFFTEGNSHQSNESRMFYSRSIEEVDAGLKILRQTAANDFSGLFCTSGSDDQHIYIKSRWDFGQVNRIGAAVASTRRPGVENQVGSLFGRWGRRGENRTDYIEYSIMKSRTQGAGGDGSIIRIGGSGSGGPKEIGWWFYYNNVNPSYYAADGIVPDPDLKGFSYGASYGDEYSSGRIRQWSVDIVGYDWNLHSGDLLSKSLSVSANVSSLNSQVYASFGREKRLDEVEGIPTLFNDHTFTLGCAWNQQEMYTRGWADVSFGRRAGGNSFYGRAKQGISLGENFHADIFYEYLRMTGPFAQREHQTVASLAYDITSEKSLSARLIGRDGDINLSIGYRHAVRSGRDIYILFGDPNAGRTKNRLILKIISPIF